MSTGKSDWEEITPAELLPAIKHIREIFDESEWKCHQITRNLCYSALHPGLVDRVALAPYEKAFAVFQSILTPSARRGFGATLSLGTPPAIFKAYFDAFRDGLEAEVRRLFNEILQIGLTNVDALKMHPVEWAKAHLHLLILQKSPLFMNWIKHVCDEQDSSKPLESDEDFKEVVFWKTWRAPRLVYMQPSGNAHYDSTNAWTRENEDKTRDLLKALSDRFIQFLEIDLNNTAGAAYVTCAKRGEPRTQIMSSNSEQAPENKKREKRAEAQDAPAEGQWHDPKKSKLPPRKQDLSAYLDSADLTERQHECMSLRFEFGMRKSEIARHLGISRKTLDVCLYLFFANC